ncbi:IQ motif and ankyrin repeat domain-containing protein 1 isoform X6 [Mauremys mutica]|uniref:IQ motif and ankyrin repeat domain-containing protein 1 isoform X6 n=1 Tax=Mauremys mutica TaxID=74926 RepID=UPI001D16B586|nr:IQ motif and ankyrin repeat domain-containing protein 1 isoform X6 [Mauremys mutica]
MGALPASPLPGDGWGRLLLRAEAERSCGRPRDSRSGPAALAGEMSDRKAAGKAAAQKGSKPASLVKKSGTASRKPALGQQAERKGTTKEESSSKLPRKSSNKQNEPALIHSPHIELNYKEKAVLTLQCAFRRILACRAREKRLREQREYTELMERLQREAFIAMVKKEQEEAERERQKEEEKKKQQREIQQRKKRMLEAAFDGDVEEMKAVLKEVSDLDTKNGVGTDEKGKATRLCNHIDMVECTDANGNTPLSEAAGGGHPSAIKLLIENGANPNCKGAFGRTPLYRAAFGGHMAAVETLLQYGADPRLYADDGNTPEQIASLDSLVAILHSWDISLTELMLQKMEAEQQRRVLQEKKQKEAETHRMSEEVEQLAKAQERCNKELQQAYCELNRRITEHDKCQRKQMVNAELTLQAIGDAETLVETLRLAAEKAEEKLSLARLRLREQTQEAGVGDEFQGLKCSVPELDDVLLKDVGGKIHSDGRWPLIIDPSGQAATFLRYRDTNYLNTLNPNDMNMETIRLALLGALRYGKPVVFDMMEVNMFDAVKRQLEGIESGLAEAILSKQILQNERLCAVNLGKIHCSLHEKQ